MAQSRFLPIKNDILQVKALRADAQQISKDEIELSFILEEYEEENETELNINWKGNDEYWQNEGELTIESDSFLELNNSSEANDQKKYLLPVLSSGAGPKGKPIYTLVLDMDETLLHYEYVSGPDHLYIRPHVEEFLKEMDQLYEIVVFTGGYQSYADKLLNILDPNKYIDYRLYRQDTIRDPLNPNIFIKDLSKLGRNLARTLIIDNTPQNFQLQTENGLEISSYYNSTDDTALLDYLPFLESLVKENVRDVRKSIQSYKENKLREEF